MGKVLYAQVEVCHGARIDHQNQFSWYWVSRWNFGKDYDAMMALSAAKLEEAWPDDADVESLEDAEIVEDRCWLSGPLLALIELPSPTYAWTSLVGSVREILEKGYAARVLFWEL